MRQTQIEETLSKDLEKVFYVLSPFEGYWWVITDQYSFLEKQRLRNCHRLSRDQKRCDNWMQYRIPDYILKQKRKKKDISEKTSEIQNKVSDLVNTIAPILTS